MFNLCCLFCAEMLSVKDMDTENHEGKCLGCGTLYHIKTVQECVRGVTVEHCGSQCTCDDSRRTH